MRLKYSAFTITPVMRSTARAASLIRYVYLTVEGEVCRRQGEIPTKEVVDMINLFSHMQWHMFLNNIIASDSNRLCDMHLPIIANGNHPSA